MPVDLRASQPHYLHHLLPVWDALPAEARGRMYLDGPVYQERSDALPANALPSSTSNPVLVAGFDDLRCVHERPVIMFEHGCGQSYAGQPNSSAARNPSHAGGQSRHGVVAFLCPNEYAASANRRTNPDVPVEIIGSPRLAYLQGLPSAPRSDKPTVAVSFHWDSPVCPESRMSFGYWAESVRDLALSGEFNMLGHGHPRIFGQLRNLYSQWGIEPVASFEEVVQRAHVYACDNSSTLFEFAALRGKVVVLDNPMYRSDIHHGLRFWDAADIGPRIADPSLLRYAIQDVLGAPTWPGADAILARVFPSVEDPAQVAASFITKHMGLVPEVLQVASPFPRVAPYIESVKSFSPTATISRS